MSVFGGFHFQRFLLLLLQTTQGRVARCSLIPLQSWRLCRQLNWRSCGIVLPELPHIAVTSGTCCRGLARGDGCRRFCEQKTVLRHRSGRAKGRESPMPVYHPRRCRSARDMVSTVFEDGTCCRRR
ncbi:hypothetical protein SJ05684_c06080 [Sinorhizobium sojae CCBAU 05684]|uniref:Uncharacterized protein n=1 Tax=Sinorhizobium sojae CCBAU 05684 TaxID=716928 RepID=A0A249P8K6_9HYPH|nr:hypothetical protein SJ05684_c06080 [Sinorhizobium sojae CCBAU 05684]